MTRNSNASWYTALQDPDVSEGVVDAAVEPAVERVWWAAFSTHASTLSREDAAELRRSIGEVLHWALHIGQSARQLLNSSEDVCQPAALSSDIWMTVEDLYRRPLIMLGTGDKFDALLRKVSKPWLVMPWTCSRARAFSRNAQFTLARSQQVGTRVEKACEAAGAPKVLRDVELRLRGNAQLYIEALTWLLSSRERKKGKISDCFVSLCALALSMSGDAVRLLWVS